MSPGLDRVRVGLIALGALLIAQTVAHIVAVFGFHTYSSVVDVDDSRSLPGMLSTAAIFVTALSAAWLARSQHRGRVEASVLAGLLALVAVADLVHTGIESVTILGALVALDLTVALVLIVRIARRSVRRASMLLLGGLSCLVAAQALSVVYHRFGALPVDRGNVLYETKLILKEGLQLAGWWLLALGLWTAAPQPRAVRANRKHSESQLDPASPRRESPGRA